MAIFTKISQKAELGNFVLIILSKNFLEDKKISKRTPETILRKYNGEKKILWSFDCGLFFQILKGRETTIGAEISTYRKKYFFCQIT